MTHENPLGTEKISKLLVQFSIPAIVGMMVNALYNIVDRVFIGNNGETGSLGLAALTYVFPVMIILVGIGILFGIGGATLFSIRLGEKNETEAQHVMGNSFVLLIMGGIFFMIFGQIFIHPILTLFGTDQESFPYALAYMRVIFFGAIFQILSMGMNNFIRADGNPKIAMLTMFFGAGVNIILDPIFIYGFNMGVSGAALATIISQFCSTVWVVRYFFSKKANIHLNFHNMKLQGHIVLKIVLLGLPGLLLQLANSLLNTILNVQLLSYGDVLAVSSMGIINSVLTVLIMPIIGLRQGSQPIISFNYGARKFNRVKEAVKKSIIVGTIIVIVAYILIRIFPQDIIWLFNKDQELIDFGSRVILIWLLCTPVIGFQIIASNYFQAIDHPKTSTFLTLTRQVIFLIPALLIFPKFWGLEGVFYAAPFADFFSFLVTAIFFFASIRKMKDDDQLTSSKYKNDYASN